MGERGLIFEMGPGIALIKIITLFPGHWCLVHIPPYLSLLLMQPQYGEQDFAVPRLQPRVAQLLHQMLHRDLTRLQPWNGNN